MKKKFAFKKITSFKNARVGKIFTSKGIIDTPAFMPVGTIANVKAMFPENIKQTNSQVILCNTYHLMLRPGENTIKKFGGIHKFMNCGLPILTDSGGYQIWSLAKLIKIEEKGVRFRSHIDGKLFFLTPEKCIKFQQKIGSDIIMVLDECPNYNITKAKEMLIDNYDLVIGSRYLRKKSTPNWSIFRLILSRGAFIISYILHNIDFITNNLFLRWPKFHREKLSQYIGEYTDVTKERLLQLQKIEYYDGPKNLRLIIAKLVKIPLIGNIFILLIKNFVMLRTVTIKK